MPERLTGKAGIRAFLLERVGVIVDTEAIREASGNQVQYGRRLRELRDEEGWPIESHNDAADLKPGEYRLAGPPPAPPPPQFARGISARLRAEVLERNGHTCQMCGIAAGELDDNGRKARLHLGHIMAKSQGGKDTRENLRALCSRCNQGAKNITQEPPTWLWLLAQLRRASEHDQRAAYDWLSTKFTEEPS
ncbi:HNH endonuclease [Candidatus Poriferisodalis sp.]|uniref:HNH endonuclease n=1 Tax=Candidatus Poriferisodalis sp. TaxID=3101277 RepID=UPI003C6EC3A5